MVMKPDEVLCCMFSSAVLALTVHKTFVELHFNYYHRTGPEACSLIKQKQANTLSSSTKLVIFTGVN